MINENKNYLIETSTGTYGRDAVKTHFVQPGEDYIELIEKYVKPGYNQDFIVSVSEKVISLCQNRIIYKSDMKVSKLAGFLSRFASTSEAGIGVNNTYKMQYAIDKCGSIKVIYASLCGGICKLFNRKGVFYDICGQEVTGLDGFYDKSFPVYGNFGIELPKNPSGVCDEIYDKTGVMTMIVDANDFTRDILGKCRMIKYTESELAEMIRDNPSGQSNQCTPFVVIKKLP